MQPLPPAMHGICPHCQSRAVRVRNEEEKHNTGWKMGAASIILFIVGIPMLLFGIGWLMIAAGVILGIVASFLPNRRLIGSYRECADCGNQWRL